VLNKVLHMKHMRFSLPVEPLFRTSIQKHNILWLVRSSYTGYQQSKRH
jgi:hypothetical protein